MRYPRMFRIAQKFDAPVVEDIPHAVRQEIRKLRPEAKIKSGQTVAISAGSRGIANIAIIVKTMVEELKRIGARPFIVPAMGSHGGGTAEGQRGILEHYGLTEEALDAPIKASMEVVQVGRTEDGISVHFDRYASEADHVVVFNRVKPHTGFSGEIESGLMKMMLIGLGKHEGAIVYHKAIVHHTFDRIVRTVGRLVLSKCPIAFGLATLENGYDQTAKIAALHPEQFEEEEKKLQSQAKTWMPKLPFMEADLLIVDKMGKDISGAGMDTNVIGRKYNEHKAAPDEYPKILRIFVRDLTEESHGNAAGLGLAEFTTTRLVENVDHHATFVNCITGSHPAAASIPIYYDTDRKILDVALSTIGLVESEQARVIRIKNTLDLGEVEVSEVYGDQIEARDDLKIISEPQEMAFDEARNLSPFH